MYAFNFSVFSLTFQAVCDFGLCTFNQPTAASVSLLRQDLVRKSSLINFLIFYSGPYRDPFPEKP